MKRLILALLTCVISNPIYSSSMALSKVVNEEPCILTLPMAKRIQALQLVVLNCLERGDYSGVSHVLHKTLLYPGQVFVEKMWAAFSKLPNTPQKEMDGCFLVYSAAIEEDHIVTRRFLSDIFCLPEIWLVCIHYRTHDRSDKLATRASRTVKKESEFCFQEDFRRKLNLIFNRGAIYEKISVGEIVTTEDREKLLAFRNSYFKLCRDSLVSDDTIRNREFRLGLLDKVL